MAYQSVNPFNGQMSKEGGYDQDGQGPAGPRRSAGTKPAPRPVDYSPVTCAQRPRRPAEATSLPLAADPTLLLRLSLTLFLKHITYDNAHYRNSGQG